MESEPQAVRCPVCASALSAPIQVCTSCHTPHHQDCAGFVGRCSVFGCGGCEFLTLDADASAVLVSDATIEETPDVDASPGAPVEPSLGRGVLARCRAAVQLLWAQRALTLGLFLFLCVGYALPGGSFAGIANILAQAILVIVLSARSRGKESSFREALNLANQRGGRIVGTALLSSLYMGVPLFGGGALLFFGVWPFNPLIAIPGLILMLVGIWQAISFALVSIVAAMGLDEEPTRALPRSRELIGVSRGQATVSYLVLTTLTLLPVVPLAHFEDTLIEWVILPVQAAICLFTTTCWLLFYLESRRALQNVLPPVTPARRLGPSHVPPA